SFPFPEKLVADFASRYEKVVVLEELDPVIENRCRALGVDVVGKEAFPAYGEYSQRMIAERLSGEAPEYETFGRDIPPRPPVLCTGCPHRGVFYILHKLGLFVSGDIGCYTLAAAPPLSAIDTTICMGASVSGLHGVLKARPDWSKNAVAVIGDSTFLHSGVTGLINIVYNRSDATVIILDNDTTGMTGHQHNPSTGFDAGGNEAPRIDLLTLCRACGVRRVTIVDPYDIRAVETAVKTELAAAEPSVIIMKRPCALLKSVVKAPPYTVDKEKCIGCKMCLAIGCPAIHMSGTANIDESSCVGCGICEGICNFGAITEVGE
ncbi:MAG: thiamine pyrophosphate-dependent enzyme, partial [Oscillospiraceae bacterium]|nr:thiamine pyrophosphate-dependent enzyme [Oscillospiraceae bacterium]